MGIISMCHLTPAHHLRGAALNGGLSAKVGKISAQSKAVAAPRLVHALVSPLPWKAHRQLPAERQGQQRVTSVVQTRARSQRPGLQDSQPKG
jgi:hypothetical protein